MTDFGQKKRRRRRRKRDKDNIILYARYQQDSIGSTKLKTNTIHGYHRWFNVSLPVYSAIK